MKPIVLIGEAFGENEARLSRPFVGSSGVALLRMLHDAEALTLSGADKQRIDLYYRTQDPRHLAAVWDRHPEFFPTNVFNAHPPGNLLAHFCGGKADGIPGYGPIIPSKYVRREFAHHLDRLGDEILERDPNLVVCLGNSAVWALTGKTGVSKLRGTTVLSSACVGNYKLLVTYHPSAVLRQADIRPTTVADLGKIAAEAASPTLDRPPCEIWIEPDVDDIKTFFRTFCAPPALISCDIETSGTRITCIGFAPRPDLALVIPFDDERKASRSYWASSELERIVWGLIREVLENAESHKTFQNGMYDIAFLLRSYGIRVMGAVHDTMLLHHALQPEALKGLAYMGSLYTSHGPWKSERKSSTETIKRDA